MKIIFSILFILTSIVGICQSGFYYKDYDWKATPDKYTLTKEELEKDQVTLLEKKLVHFFEKGEQFVKCVLEHKIIRLNNDKAVEMNNKYYVANYGSIEVIKQKARVITPSGKIIELSSTDIKTANDEEGNPQYQYFAFEGIEVGSIIEYFHVMLFNPKLTGDESNVQGEFLKKRLEHEIIAPSHLEFKIKTINGLKEFTLDTAVVDYHRYYLHLDDVEGVTDETESAYDAMIKKYYYMLYKNTASGKSNFYNYQDVTKNIHQNYFAPLEKKEKKAITKFINESKAHDAKSTIDKVRCIENFLKSKYAIQDEYFENADKVGFILKNNVMNEVGAAKVFINAFRELNIPFELVYTCDRFEDRFIEGYEGYNFLNEILIYINELDTYISPNLITRVGFPEYNLVHSKGLFIKEIKIGELVSSVGKVREIKGSKMDVSIDEINTVAKIQDDKVTTNIQVERKVSGYKAFEQSYITYVNDDAKKELLEGYVNYIDSETKPESYTIENDSSNLYGFKPLIGKGTLLSPNFTEQAGNKILFKIGMLIGPQTNLYNKEERKLPVEMAFPRKYVRTIVFEIPEGYEVKDPQVLNMNVKVSLENNTSLGFVSSYEIKGNQLIVKINEWYETVFVPVKDYKSYENVINAAADFNKIKIVLEKK